MAIRRPSVTEAVGNIVFPSPDWFFQDSLYQSMPGSVERYLQVKWDGEPYTRVSQTFDYSNPPYVGPEQRGGSVVGQIDYTVNNNLITINNWWVDWRDEWPLRLATNYLEQCLYPPSKGFIIRVQGQEVYSQDGTPIPVADKGSYAFWVSERFTPLTNKPDDYLLRIGDAGSSPNPTPIVYSFSSQVQVTVPETYILVTINSKDVPLQTPLYWRLTGEVTPAFLKDGFTEGLILINKDTAFLKLPLDLPLPGPGPYTANIAFFTDPLRKNTVGFTELAVTG
jgi:hypothetical protein